MKSKHDNPDNLVCASLETLWWGVSIGGKHYTGEVVLRDPFRKIEMIRKLSRKEAKEISDREGRMWLSMQTQTNKFDTLKQLERHAEKWCRENLGSSWVLFDGDRLNPSRVIASSGWISENVKTMNKLASMWAKVPNQKRDWNHPAIRQIYALWEQLLSGPNK